MFVQGDARLKSAQVRPTWPLRMPVARLISSNQAGHPNDPSLRIARRMLDAVDATKPL